MASSAEEALQAMVALAGAQLEILEDAQRRPELNRAEVVWSCLELLLRGMAHELGPLATSSAVSAQLRENLAAFAQRVERFEHASVQVRATTSSRCIRYIMT